MIDLDCITQAARGQEQAQRLLFEAYADRVYRTARRYVGDGAAAEDVVSDTFIKALAGMGQASFAEVGAFEAWLRRIAVNEALGWLRRRRMLADWDETRAATLVDSGPDPLELLSGKALLAELDTLPLGYRTVLQLFALEGYSHLEIAQQLGISEGASRSQLSKARAYLKRRLAQLKLI